MTCITFVELSADPIGSCYHAIESIALVACIVVLLYCNTYLVPFGEVSALLALRINRNGDNLMPFCQDLKPG